MTTPPNQTFTRMHLLAVQDTAFKHRATREPLTPYTL